jgi:hypothetical protein
VAGGRRHCAGKGGAAVAALSGVLHRIHPDHVGIINLRQDPDFLFAKSGSSAFFDLGEISPRFPVNSLFSKNFRTGLFLDDFEHLSRRRFLQDDRWLGLLRFPFFLS